MKNITPLKLFFIVASFTILAIAAIFEFNIVPEALLALHCILGEIQGAFRLVGLGLFVGFGFAAGVGSYLSLFKKEAK